MAQPNVVREPSMDEILASIRRIIESNDPVPPGVVTSMPEPEGFSGSAANDDMEEVPLTIDDAFSLHRETARTQRDAPFPKQAPEPTFDAPPYAEETVSQPQKSLSLADVAARVRAASERNPGLREIAPRQVVENPPQATSPLVTSRMAAAGGAQPPERLPTEWDRLPPYSEEHSASLPPEVETVQPETGPELSELAAEEQQGAPVSLISADAGQQVARSFQDLAVAIDQAERRSYDEIAAELLRPMLQEWLDENLPTLVERLVREEIERVARGNRR